MTGHQHDSSMLDLFRQEMESNSAVLNQGILVLESGATSATELEKLMRAAHSIKGAARIIGIDPIVEVAHVLESCFVAAQEGKASFSAGDFDLLLQCADVFAELAGESDEEFRSLAEVGLDRLKDLAKALGGLGTGDVAPSPATETAQVSTPAPPPAEEALPTAGSSPSGKQGSLAVQISAENLDQLLGLAGEVLVESRWVAPAASKLRQLKCKHLAILSEISSAEGTGLDGATAQRKLEFLRNRLDQCQELLAELLQGMEERATRTTDTSQRLYQEVLGCRMRPFSDTLAGHRRMVRDVARRLGKEVRLEVRGVEAKVDREILAKLEAPIGHMLRNALDHGIEPPEQRLADGKPAEGSLVLEARHSNGMLFLSVEDDGAGIQVEKIRQAVEAKGLAPTGMAQEFGPEELMEFLFLPGFSLKEGVTEISGRGVGLDAVRDAVKEVGGVVRAHSTPCKGTRIELQLPVTLSLVRALLVEVSGEKYGLPLNRIEAAVNVSAGEILELEGKPCFRHHEDLVCLVRAGQVLGLEGAEGEADPLKVVVIRSRERRFGLIVDAFLGEKQLTVLPLPDLLGKVEDVSAGTVLEDGSPALILDLEDLLRSAQKLLASGRLAQARRIDKEERQEERKRVLVVDDSLTVREVQRQLLESQGYEVVSAVDGIDGWNAMRSGSFDLVVSDVDMPRMDGIEFVKRVRSDPRLGSTPIVIISYKDRPGDRARGLEAGANLYLTKGSFHDDKFINTVSDLLQGRNIS